MVVFREYDVRAKYPSEINEELIRKIGYAFARYIKAETIWVGRDVRTSSPSLHKAFTTGILETGTNVKDLGVCTTPQVQHLAKECPAAIITASHNPKQYNGVKLYRKGGRPVAKGSGLEEVEARLEKATRPGKKGKMTKKSTSSAYVSHLTRFAKTIDPKLRVVIDAANGSAGAILPALVKKLPIKHIKKLYWKADGTFPNHPPNPLRASSVAAVRKAIKEYKAHIGVVFDADADRALFLDDKGQTIPPEIILVLFSRRYKTPRVAHDLRMGWVLREELRKVNGEGIRTRVGRTHIYSTMREYNAQLGGELSGHYYFKANGCGDDALIAMIKVFNAISSSEKLSDVIAPLRRYAKSEELNFEIKDRQGIITKVYNMVQQKYRGCKIDFLDGLSVKCKDWWFNIRLSNTQPVVRVVCEAKDKKTLDKRVRFLKKFVSKQ